MMMIEETKGAWLGSATWLESSTLFTHTYTTGWTHSGVQVEHFLELPSEDSWSPVCLYAFRSLWKGLWATILFAPLPQPGLLFLGSIGDPGDCPSSSKLSQVC